MRHQPPALGRREARPPAPHLGRTGTGGRPPVGRDATQPTPAAADSSANRAVASRSAAPASATAARTAAATWATGPTALGGTRQGRVRPDPARPVDQQPTVVGERRRRRRAGPSPRNRAANSASTWSTSISAGSTSVSSVRSAASRSRAASPAAPDQAGRRAAARAPRASARRRTGPVSPRQAAPAVARPPGRRTRAGRNSCPRRRADRPRPRRPRPPAPRRRGRGARRLAQEARRRRVPEPVRPGGGRALVDGLVAVGRAADRLGAGRHPGASAPHQSWTADSSSASATPARQPSAGTTSPGSPASPWASRYASAPSDRATSRSSSGLTVNGASASALPGSAAADGRRRHRRTPTASRGRAGNGKDVRRRPYPGVGPVDGGRCAYPQVVHRRCPRRTRRLICSPARR